MIDEDLNKLKSSDTPSQVIKLVERCKHALVNRRAEEIATLRSSQWLEERKKFAMNVDRQIPIGDTGPLSLNAILDLQTAAGTPQEAENQKDSHTIVMFLAALTKVPTPQSSAILTETFLSTGITLPCTHYKYAASLCLVYMEEYI
jgi:hypothetical protein